MVVQGTLSSYLQDGRYPAIRTPYYSYCSSNRTTAVCRCKLSSDTRSTHGKSILPWSHRSEFRETWLEISIYFQILKRFSHVVRLRVPECGCSYTRTVPTLLYDSTSTVYGGVTSEGELNSAPSQVREGRYRYFSSPSRAFRFAVL